MAKELTPGQTALVFPSQSRTATPTPVAFKAHGGGVRGILLFLNVTALSLTPSINVVIEAASLVGSTWQSVVTFPAITSVSSTVYIVYPGVSETIAEANLVVQAIPIPASFRVQVIHANANAITYSLELQALT